MPGPLARASGRGGDATLIVAAAIAAATSYTTIYTDFNIAVVVAGCAALAVLTVLRRTPQVPSAAVLCLALLIGLIPQWWRPPIGNVDRGPLFPLAVGLGMLASVLLLLGAVVAARRWLLGTLAYLSAAAAAVLVVQASARPAIDVWVIFQQSTRGLLAGRNPYEMAFSGIPPGQTDNCFNYLPFTFLASLPGRVAFGDVRYGELLVLLAGSALLIWVVRRARPAERASLALLLVVMVLALPGTLRIAQQAWNESVILGLLLAAVALLLSDRAGLAVIPLGLALATKQHVVLVLPLWALWPSFGWRRALTSGALAAGICVPWVLASPGRFYGCTVRFFLDLPARPDSISLWRFLPPAAQIPAVLALTVAGYLLAYRFLDRSTASLVLGCGLVFAAFDLANKQTFENQWLLACQLLVAGLACRAVEQPASGPVPPAPFRKVRQRPTRARSGTTTGNQPGQGGRLMSELGTSASVTIHAPVDQVWKALTTPELIRQWFFGVDTETDWRVGGPLVHRGEYQGKPYVDKGEIVRLEPPKLLVHTHWSDLSGKPDRPEHYQQVTWALTDRDGATELTVSEENLPSEEAKVVSEQSWKAVLRNLKDLLET